MKLNATTEMMVSLFVDALASNVIIDPCGSHVIQLQFLLVDLNLNLLVTQSIKYINFLSGHTV